MKIIGIAGLPGSGKSFLVNQLKEDNHFKIIKLGEYIRENGKYYGSTQLIQASNFIKDTLSTGSIIEIFQKQISSSINDNKIIVIDSIRTKEDILFLKKNYEKEYIILAVIANRVIRQKRVLERHKNGDPLNEKDFIELDNWEMQLWSSIYLQISEYLVNNRNDTVKFKDFVYSIVSEERSFV